MKRIFNILSAIFVLFSLIMCKKEKSPLSLENVKYNSNKITYPTTQMDSLQAINAITKQKVQEVLDLSILYASSNKDTEIDSTMYSQILGYFYKADSTTLKPLMQEIDSLKVRNVAINKFEVMERYREKDTLNFAKFEVEYFDKDNKTIVKTNREAQYILVPAPVKFKKEFKFYFLNFYSKFIENDSISSGQTK